MTAIVKSHENYKVSEQKSNQLHFDPMFYSSSPALLSYSPHNVTVKSPTMQQRFAIPKQRPNQYSFQPLVSSSSDYKSLAPFLSTNQRFKMLGWTTFSQLDHHLREFLFKLGTASIPSNYFTSLINDDLVHWSDVEMKRFVHVFFSDCSGHIFASFANWVELKMSANALHDVLHFLHFMFESAFRYSQFTEIVAFWKCNELTFQALRMNLTQFNENNAPIRSGLQSLILCLQKQLLQFSSAFLSVKDNDTTHLNIIPPRFSCSCFLSFQFQICSPNSTSAVHENQQSNTLNHHIPSSVILPPVSNSKSVLRAKMASNNNALVPCPLLFDLRSVCHLCEYSHELFPVNADDAELLARENDLDLTSFLPAVSQKPLSLVFCGKGMVKGVFGIRYNLSIMNFIKEQTLLKFSRVSIVFPALTYPPRPSSFVNMTIFTPNKLELQQFLYSLENLLLSNVNQFSL